MTESTQVQAKQSVGVADKTGSGEYGTTNDIGVLFPPRRAPVLVASYLTGIKANSPTREAALAQVGASGGVDGHS